MVTTIKVKVTNPNFKKEFSNEIGMNDFYCVNVYGATNKIARITSDQEVFDSLEFNCQGGILDQIATIANR